VTVTAFRRRAPVPGGAAIPAVGVALWPAIALAMAIAAVLRFPGLMDQSLWVDELYSVDMLSWPVSVILYVQDGHPPGFALLHLVVAQIVDADVAGRLIAAVAGVAAVGLLVRLAAELWDVRTGLVAGYLLAVSPLHVWYSQEGRSYAVVVLIGVGASLALIRAVRRPSGGAWIAFALWSVAGLFTHYLYAALLVAQGVYLALVGGQGRLLLALGAAVVVGLACLPVLGPEATQFVGDQRGFEWLALPYTAFTFLVGFGLGPSVEELHRNRGLDAIWPYWPAIEVVAGVALAATFAAPRAIAKAGPWSRYVLLWLLVPIVFVFGGSWARDGAFNVRYVIVALPALMLLLALVLTDGGTFRLVVGLTVATGLALTSIAIDRFDPRHQREDVRAAAEFLDHNAAAGDRILVSARYMDSALGHYYRGPVTPVPLSAQPMWSAADVARTFDDVRASSQRTWLVLSREWDDDPNGEFRAALRPWIATATRARFPGVVILELPPPATPPAAGS
jgi:mannosyltransferase